MHSATADSSVAHWAALREQPFELLSAIEMRVRATKLDLAAGASQSWTGLAFRVREHWLLAPREDVREVIVLPRLTRVPGAKPWLAGVANVRGSLLPISDLGLYAGLAPAVEARSQRALTFNSERQPAGLLVDEVAGYRSFVPADQRSERVPALAALEPYLLGGFVRDARHWQVLSLHRLVSDAAFVQAAA